MVVQVFTDIHVIANMEANRWVSLWGLLRLRMCGRPSENIISGGIEKLWGILRSVCAFQLLSGVMARYADPAVIASSSMVVLIAAKKHGGCSMQPTAWCCGASEAFPGTCPRVSRRFKNIPVLIKAKCKMPITPKFDRSDDMVMPERHTRRFSDIWRASSMQGTIQDGVALPGKLASSESMY